jgi:hypothetical protein
MSRRLWSSGEELVAWAETNLRDHNGKRLEIPATDRSELRSRLDGLIALSAERGRLSQRELEARYTDWVGRWLTCETDEKPQWTLLVELGSYVLDEDGRVSAGGVVQSVRLDLEMEKEEHDEDLIQQAADEFWAAVESPWTDLHIEVSRRARANGDPGLEEVAAQATRLGYYGGLVAECLAYPEPDPGAIVLAPAIATIVSDGNLEAGRRLMNAIYWSFAVGPTPFAAWPPSSFSTWMEYVRPVMVEEPPTETCLPTFRELCQHYHTEGENDGKPGRFAAGVSRWILHELSLDLSEKNVVAAAAEYADLRAFSLDEEGAATSGAT